MTILVIDDDPLIRRVVEKLLTRGGFKVNSVTNGLSALSELRTTIFDAIVCDVKLPFLSGDDFFAQVRELFPNQAKRIVFITGFAGDPEVEQFLQESGQPFLLKPFKPDEFVEVVKGVAEARE
jgi:CheY-like chemotaxis protein